MKIIFMGTPLFAIPSLERLVHSSHEVDLVVTQPDKPAGRGRKIKAPPVKEFALEHGIEILQPASIRGADFLEGIKERSPDAIVVVAYGKILPPDLLEAPRLGCVNVHASLLPRYRGAAPINWAIIRGETETGVTIVKMDEGLDTGDIIHRERVEILDDDDALSLSNILAVTGADVLVEVLDEAEKTGSLMGEPQDESQASYAPLLKKEDGRIDWARPTEKIICLVRGMISWSGAFTPQDESAMKILAAEPLWPAACESIAAPERIPPGTIALTLKSRGFAVRTADGFLLVTKAQPRGKRAMSGVDMINGKLVRTGDVLTGD